MFEGSRSCEHSRFPFPDTWAASRRILRKFRYTGRGRPVRRADFGEFKTQEQILRELAEFTRRTDVEIARKTLIKMLTFSPKTTR
jgi:hypothetical protein